MATRSGEASPRAATSAAPLHVEDVSHVKDVSHVDDFAPTGSDVDEVPAGSDVSAEVACDDVRASPEDDSLSSDEWATLDGRLLNIGLESSPASVCSLAIKSLTG